MWLKTCPPWDLWAPRDLLWHLLFIFVLPSLFTSPSPRSDSSSGPSTWLPWSPRSKRPREHHANELVNNVLEPRQLFLCGIQETHWLGQQAMLKAKGYMFFCSRHEDGVHRGKVALALVPRAAASLLNWEPMVHAYYGLNCYWRRVSICGLLLHMPTLPLIPMMLPKITFMTRF
jgi:hypothetical protein